MASASVPSTSYTKQGSPSMSTQADHSRMKTTNGSILSHNNSPQVEVNQYFQGGQPMPGTSTSRREDFTYLKPCPLPSPLFTGREEILEKMRCYFLDTVAQCHVFVLYGLGGAGKTEIALKFINQYCGCSYKVEGRELQHLFYIDATSESTIESSFERIAVAAGVQETSSRAVDWISHLEEKWFLYMDNADNPDINLRRYFPCNRLGGKILITTRNERAQQYRSGGEESSARVDNMPLVDAVALLTKISPTAAADARQPEGGSVQDIAQALELFPLALAQAGATMNKLYLSPSEYLDMLNERPDVLFDESIEEDAQYVHGHPKSMATVWKISIDNLTPIARDVLSILSLLHHSEIPEEIFERASEATGSLQDCPVPLCEAGAKALSELVDVLSAFKDSKGFWSKPSFRRIISELASYSLIMFTPPIISVHPLFHKQIRSLFKLGQKHAELFLAAAFVGTDWYLYSLDYEFRRLLLLHASVVFDRGTPENMDDPCAHRSAQLYNHLGRWEELVKLATCWKTSREQELGEDHPSMIDPLQYLSVGLGELKKWEEAQLLETRILRIQTKRLSYGHPDCLLTMNNIAITLAQLGRWEDCKALQEFILQLQKNKLGVNHPSTLNCMSSLAVTFGELGQWAECQSLASLVLEASQEALGLDHPAVLQSIHSLEVCSQQLGKLDDMRRLQIDFEAIVESRQAESNSKRRPVKAVVRHSRHSAHSAPEVDSSQHESGSSGPQLTTLAMDDIMHGETLRLQLDQLTSRLSRPLHPRSIRKANRFPIKLYMVYRPSSLRKQGDTSLHDEQKLSVQLYEETVSLRTQILGRKHPQTIASMFRLADSLVCLERYKEAAKFAKEVLDIRTELFGEDHPQTKQVEKFLERIQVLEADSEEHLKTAPVITEETSPAPGKAKANARGDNDRGSGNDFLLSTEETPTPTAAHTDQPGDHSQSAPSAPAQAVIEDRDSSAKEPDPPPAQSPGLDPVGVSTPTSQSPNRSPRENRGEKTHHALPTERRPVSSNEMTRSSCCCGLINWKRGK